MHTVTNQLANPGRQKLEFGTLILLALLIALFLYSPLALAGMTNNTLTAICVGHVARFDPTTATTMGESPDCDLPLALLETRAVTIVMKQDAKIHPGPITLELSNPPPAVTARVFHAYFLKLEKNSAFYKEDIHLAPGWYTDPLVPGERIEPDLHGDTTSMLELDGTRYAQFMIDLTIHDTSLSVPTGITYKIKSGDSEFSGSIIIDPVKLRIPQEFSLDSLFVVRSNIDGNVPDLLLQHRITPSKIKPSQVLNLSEIFGFRSFPLGFWSGADIDNCKFSDPPGRDLLAAAVTKIPQRLRILNYSADEVARCPEAATHLRSWADALHEFGVKQLVTMPTRLSEDKIRDEGGEFDIIALLPKDFAAWQRNSGEDVKEVWGYTALSQDAGSPKWLLDSPLSSYRIFPGFYAFRFGWKGILYWSADHLPADIWQVPFYSTHSGLTYYGEGALVYSWNENGSAKFLPSIRLKALRDGFMDYELLSILDKCANKFGHKLHLELVKSLTSWERDLARIEAGRRTAIQWVLNWRCQSL